MTPRWRLALWVLTVLAASTPLRAQAPPDYLTDEEVQKVRETQEPNKRVLLFLEIASARLNKFEQAIAARPPVHVDELTEVIDHYISAIDDATSNLEITLDRGGVNLAKAREEIEKQAPALLTRLEKLTEAQRDRLEEFRITWDDSLEATRELLETAKKIPEGAVPAKSPAPVRGQEEKPQPGRPTLRKKDEPPKPPPPPPKP